MKISVVNQKGGVGKTTTSINISAVLASLGQKVLLVDLDPQANATSGLGIDYANLEQGLYNVLIGEVDAKDVIKPTNTANLFVLPSTLALAGASVEIVSLEDREFLLSRVLEKLESDFDFIIIDCPPSLGLLTINGLVAADKILIPVQAEYYALEGLGQLLNTIGLIQDNISDKLEVLGVVITMYDKRNKIAKQVLSELDQYFPYYVFKTIIPRNVRLAEAPSHGKSILEYEFSSRGAQAYLKLGQEIKEILKL